MTPKTHYSHEEINVLLEKITPGQWEYLPCQKKQDEKTYVFTNSGVIAGSVSENDAIFIATAPVIIDLLLEERAELKRKIEGKKATTVDLKGEFELPLKEIVKNTYNTAISDVLSLFEEKL